MVDERSKIRQFRNILSIEFDNLLGLIKCEIQISLLCKIEGDQLISIFNFNKMLESNLQTNLLIKYTGINK